MIRINENYQKLKASYLFSEIAKRVSAFQKEHPQQDIIRLGIGDVVLPLPPVCVEAFKLAVEEMGSLKGFRGYGPEQGYEFLREKIAQFDYRQNGCEVNADEIFISDGSKCDTGNIQEIFALDCRVAVPDPVYPVYVDTNVMAGRTGNEQQGRYAGLEYLPCVEAQGFVPALPQRPADLIYLCSPNNPTGAVMTRSDLEQWVAYARAQKAILLFDAAYESFIRDPELPRSIYQIPGAREVAIEFRSFSKTAGFTGTRCAFTVVPKSLMAWDSSGTPYPVHALWNRRHSTKFNGVSYPVQRAAEAVYTEVGRQQVRGLSDYYLENARLLSERLTELGYRCSGGKNAPYLWIHVGSDSWQFFDRLLKQAAIVCTPGAGFGSCGEGYVRLSAFNVREKVLQALERIPAFPR